MSEKMTRSRLEAWLGKGKAPEPNVVKESGLRPGAVKLPFEHVPREKYLEMIRGKQVAERTLTAPVQRVKLSEVKGIQRTVNQERLHAYLENPQLTPSGKRAAGSGMLVDKPVVVRVGGELYLHDGHHRLTAAHVRGEDSIEARIVEIE